VKIFTARLSLVVNFLEGLGDHVGKDFFVFGIIGMSVLTGQDVDAIIKQCTTTLTNTDEM
jgi:hypothetical protein